MKIAIVGSSKAKYSYTFVRNTIIKLVEEFGNIEIVSGESTGIDQDAKNTANVLKLPYKPFPPKSWTSQDLLARNREIAQYADLVISIALPLVRTPCYHCELNAPEHEKTAGCYTAKHAKKMGKPVRLLIDK